MNWIKNICTKQNRIDKINLDKSIRRTKMIIDRINGCIRRKRLEQKLIEKFRIFKYNHYGHFCVMEKNESWVILDVGKDYPNEILSENYHEIITEIKEEEQKTIFLRN